MARKKKEKQPQSGPFNPYYGKAKDESKMAEKPFWTWILAVPGVLLGIFIGLGTHELVLGPVFGGIMGIAIGSLIDKAIEKRRNGKS